MESQLDTILTALPYLLAGTVNTALIVIAAMAIGLCIGVPAAAGLVYGPQGLRRALSAYLWFFRGVPVLTLLFLFYFGLFPLLHLQIPALAAVAVVLGLTTGAYQANIFRGAILSLVCLYLLYNNVPFLKCFFYISFMFSFYFQIGRAHV